MRKKNLVEINLRRSTNTILDKNYLSFEHLGMRVDLNFIST